MIIKVGWMYKYGKMLFFSWWNNYWFVLNQVTCSLSYYNSPKQLKLVKSFHLDGRHFIWGGEGVADIKTPPWLKKSNIICIFSKSRKIVLCCTNDMETQSWREILQTFRPEYFPQREKLTEKVISKIRKDENEERVKCRDKKNFFNGTFREKSLREIYPNTYKQFRLNKKYCRCQNKERICKPNEKNESKMKDNFEDEEEEDEGINECFQDGSLCPLVPCPYTAFQQYQGDCGIGNPSQNFNWMGEPCLNSMAINPNCFQGPSLYQNELQPPCTYYNFDRRQNNDDLKDMLTEIINLLCLQNNKIKTPSQPQHPPKPQFSSPTSAHYPSSTTSPSSLQTKTTKSCLNKYKKKQNLFTDEESLKSEIDQENLEKFLKNNPDLKIPEEKINNKFSDRKFDHEAKTEPLSEGEEPIIPNFSKHNFTFK